jgi:hypothetical protein
MGKLLVVHCHFNHVEADFATEVLSLKSIIKALNYFKLPDSHMYIHLKNVYKSFVYIDLFHTYWTTKGYSYLDSQRYLLIELAIIFGRNLKIYSAKNIILKDILKDQNLKTLEMIFKNDLDVYLFLLMINFPENRRVRPAPQPVVAGQRYWFNSFNWLNLFRRNDNQIIPAQPHPPAQQNPVQAEHMRLEMIKEVQTNISRLGEGLLNHLKSVIIDNEHSIFIRFFADGLQTLEDFQFLQKIVRLASCKQKILLEYIEKLTAWPKFYGFLRRVRRNMLPLFFCVEIENRFWSNRAFVDLVAELLRSNPSSKVSANTLDIKIKTEKHLKVIESIFCHETLDLDFPNDKFQIMKDLFFCSDCVEEILQILITKSLYSSINNKKYIEVLKLIPDIQNQKEISHILKSNKNELEDLKTVTTLLLTSQLSKKLVKKFLKQKRIDPPVSLNHAIVTGMIFRMTENNGLWTILKKSYSVIDGNMDSNLNIRNKIVNKEGADLPYVEKHLNDLLGQFRPEPFMETISITEPDPKNIDNNDVSLGSAVEGNENSTSDDD